MPFKDISPPRDKCEFNETSPSTSKVDDRTTSFLTFNDESIVATPPTLRPALRDKSASVFMPGPIIADAGIELSGYCA